MTNTSSEDHTSICNINRFFVSAVSRLASDIGEEKIAERVGIAGDTGNSPLWILGHLALCVDFCEMLLGDAISHPRWVPIFGPGSPGEITKPSRYSSQEFIERIEQGYTDLQGRLLTSDEERLKEPHELEIFADSALTTKRDVFIHLMTTHLAFHVAQLSRCRKALGHERIL